MTPGGAILVGGKRSHHSTITAPRVLVINNGFGDWFGDDNISIALYIAV